MNSSHKPNLENSSACHHTPSENGCEDFPFEMKTASPHRKPSEMDSSVRPQADNPEHSFTFGTDPKRQPCSTECAIRGPFSIQTNNSLGQEILNCDGLTIAWTIDPWVAQVIVKLLTENDGLLV